MVRGERCDHRCASSRDDALRPEHDDVRVEAEGLPRDARPDPDRPRRQPPSPSTRLMPSAASARGFRAGRAGAARPRDTPDGVCAGADAGQGAAGQTFGQTDAGGQSARARRRAGREPASGRRRRRERQPLLCLRPVVGAGQRTCTARQARWSKRSGRPVSATSSAQLGQRDPGAATRSALCCRGPRRRCGGISCIVAGGAVGQAGAHGLRADLRGRARAGRRIPRDRRRRSRARPCTARRPRVQKSDFVALALADPRLERLGLRAVGQRAGQLLLRQLVEGEERPPAPARAAGARPRTARVQAVTA